MGGHTVGQIARGRTAKHGKAELHVACGGNRNDAILVRERRMIDGVILDVQLGDPELGGEPFGLDQRRKSRVEPCLRRLDRQQLQIAP